MIRFALLIGLAAGNLSSPLEAQNPASPSTFEGRRGQPLVGAVAAPDTTSPAATAKEFPWVGSFADGVYFRATCAAAQDLAPSNRRYFATETSAVGAGFRRSRVPGC